MSAVFDPAPRETVKRGPFISTVITIIRGGAQVEVEVSGTPKRTWSEAYGTEYEIPDLVICINNGEYTNKEEQLAEDAIIEKWGDS